MNWPFVCAAVIPCLDEEAAIYPLVSKLRAYLPHVIVVDDGSSDSTAERARAAGAEVIRHAQSLGKGRALQAGWLRARERGFAWALALDGDGQHAPEDAPTFLCAAEKGGADLLLGNRMEDAARMPWLRRQVNRWMSARISRLLGISVQDSQCGYRLMRLDAWAGLELRATHYEVESETLRAFAAAGCVIESVPVRVIYQGERSKIHPVRDTLRWLRWYREARRRALLKDPKSEVALVKTARPGPADSELAA